MGNEWQLIDQDDHNRPKRNFYWKKIGLTTVKVSTSARQWDHPLWWSEKQVLPGKKEQRLLLHLLKKKNPVPFICLPRFYSSSSAFLNVSPPPSSLTTDHEKSKYVHEVKQSVNLWNTLAMRSASLYSFQLQKKKKKIEEEKKPHNVGHHFRGDIQYPWAFSFHTDE